MQENDIFFFLPEKSSHSIRTAHLKTISIEQSAVQA